MADDEKRNDKARAVNIQTWQLPELDGPTISDEDALGNRRRRAERRQAQDRRTKPRAPQEPAVTDVVEEEIIEPPSAAELQALRDAAREEGFAEGREAGEQAGYKAGHQEGLVAGREDGFEEGRSEGLQTAETETQAAIEVAQRDAAASLAQAITTLGAQEQALEDELAPVMRDLILRLTQGLVVQSLQQSPEQIEDIVHQAIQLMPSAHERMQILLHPDDCSVLKGLELHWLRQVDLQPDDTLSPGGCLVKTRHSLLDYTLNQRYQKQIQSLLELPLDDSRNDSDELRSLTRERFQALVEQSESIMRSGAEGETRPEQQEPEPMAESGTEPADVEDADLPGDDAGNRFTSDTRAEEDNSADAPLDDDDDSAR